MAQRAQGKSPEIVNSQEQGNDKRVRGGGSASLARGEGALSPSTWSKATCTARTAGERGKALAAFAGGGGAEPQ